jgi:beta-lactamase superfamily II metal-dependent hydrolase
MRKAKRLGRGGPGSRRLYGFVDGVVEAEPDNKYSRQTLLLDCIDADAFDADPAALNDAANLSLVQTATTRRRWDEDFGIESIEEGDWVQIELRKGPGQPRAWEMPYTAGYEPEGSTNVLDIVVLNDVDGSPGARLASACQLRSSEFRWESEAELGVEGMFEMVSAPLRIVALDVGQASCNSIFSNGKPLVLFDAGAPLYRNQKSFRAVNPSDLPNESGIVLLSHWDFDHFDLGRRRQGLQQLTWFAPHQPVGPNTLEFQRSLGANLYFLQGSYSMKSKGLQFDLKPGLATNPKDRNGTGYSLRIEDTGGNILLTGDAGYQQIDQGLLVDLAALTVPHHGGAGAAPPPPAAAPSRAVVSYGNPNCYRHPVAETIDAHDAANWQVEFTAKHGVFGRRGNRQVWP